MAARTTPQDHKSKATDLFKITISGQTFELPKMDNVATFSVMRRLRNMDPIQQMFQLLEDNVDKVTMKRLEQALDPLGTDGIGDFLTAWQDDAEVTLGESPSSSD